MTGINSEAYNAPYREQAYSLSLSLSPNTYWQRYIALGSRIQLNTVSIAWCIPEVPQPCTANRDTHTHWLARHTRHCGTSLALILHPYCWHTYWNVSAHTGKDEPSTASRRVPCHLNTWIVSSWISYKGAVLSIAVRRESLTFIHCPNIILPCVAMSWKYLFFP